MNFDRNISSTQITWIVGLLLGLGLAFVLGTAIGQQDFRKVSLIIGAGIGIAVFLALGKNYWLLIPLSLGAKFPAVPLGGRTLEFPELCIAGCSLMFILRVATRKEKMRLFVPINTPFLLFMAWVGMVFLIHPIGFSMLGASVGGGRFYLKLALAFAAFVILSNRTYTEKDIKSVLGLLVFGAFFGMIYGIFEFAALGPSIDRATGMEQEEFYSWHQLLSWPAFTISFLIFSRWSPREVFGLQRPVILLLYLACFILVLMSGKRMGLAAVLLAPVVSAIMYRQFVYLPVAAAILMALTTTLVAGQGQWFNLPLIAQRTLSWLPGDWDQELQSMRGGADDFRTELRRMAWNNIKSDPIVGQGYAMNMGDILTTMTLQQQVGGLDIVTAGHAISRNWHNVWLGYAADFGIPMSVMQAVIFLTVLFVAAKVFRYYSNASMLGVFGLYVFIFTCRDLMASHTGGHTSLDAFERWWMYGILISIYLQVKNYTAVVRDRPSSAGYQRTPQTAAPGR
jgi:hypothetical protein